MAPLQAITIDFWNTLADGASAQKERGLERYQPVLRAAGWPANENNLHTLHIATRALIDEYEEERLIDLKATDAGRMLSRVCDKVGISLPEADHNRLVSILQRSMLSSPPALIPGVKQTIRNLAREYKLAVISDTLFSPGFIIKEYLENQRLLSCFDGFVFSDETGVVKPHPLAFRSALNQLEVHASESVHIGDLKRTDINGALNAGMRAIQFTGVWTDTNEGRNPDVVLEDWLDLPDLLRNMHD